MWNHLEPKKNPVGHGSELERQEKVQNQRDRAGGEASRRDRMHQEQGGRKKGGGGEEEGFKYYTSVHTCAVWKHPTAHQACTHRINANKGGNRGAGTL